MISGAREVSHSDLDLTLKTNASNHGINLESTWIFSVSIMIYNSNIYSKVTLRYWSSKPFREKVIRSSNNEVCSKNGKTFALRVSCRVQRHS